MPNRITPAPSNSTGPFGGTAYMEDVADEVSGLWRYSSVPATVTAGVNNVFADCDVPIAANAVGQQFSIVWTAVNTAAMTLRIDSKTAKPLRDASGVALPAGYTAIGRLDTVIDMGAEYRITSSSGGSGGSGTLLRACCAYQLTRNTVGGSLTLNARTRYPFNTVLYNTIPGFSLDSTVNIGRMTVPARTYERIEAICHLRADPGGIYLRNFTDGADVTGIARAGSDFYGARTLKGPATFSAAKQIQVEYFANNTSGGTFGLGAPVNDTAGNSPEQYGYIIFESYA